MGITASETKTIMVIQPAAIVDNASFTTIEVDTVGFEYASFYYALGATDIALTVLKMQESLTSGSGMADVTGLIFGTSDNDGGSTSTLPSATDDDSIFIMDIDLKARLRYLDPIVTMGDGAVGGFVCAWCVLSRGHATPMLAATRGASQRLIL